MADAPNPIRTARKVCRRCRIGHYVSNGMPDPDRFCTNCGYREPREGESAVDFRKLFGR